MQQQVRATGVLSFGGLLILGTTLFLALSRQSNHSAPQLWTAAVPHAGQAVELFEWTTGNDPAVHGTSDLIVGADADDPNFHLRDLAPDHHMDERMIPGAEETRCPMCWGTQSYYQLEGSDERYEKSGAIEKNPRGRGRAVLLPKNNPAYFSEAVASGPMSKIITAVQDPSQALQAMLARVQGKIKEDVGLYRQVDGSRTKTEALVRLYTKKLQGLDSEVGDVKRELTRIAEAQQHLVVDLPTGNRM